MYNTNSMGFTILNMGQILNSFSWSGLHKHLTIYLSGELRRKEMFVPLFISIKIKSKKST